MEDVKWIFVPFVRSQVCVCVCVPVSFARKCILNASVARSRLRETTDVVSVLREKFFTHPHRLNSWIVSTELFLFLLRALVELFLRLAFFFCRCRKHVFDVGWCVDFHRISNSIVLNFAHNVSVFSVLRLREETICIIHSFPFCSYFAAAIMTSRHIQAHKER